jgi:hypothetical protein
MYCPSCGNQNLVELNYCNRCGANLALPTAPMQTVITEPPKLVVPSVVLGMTILGGLSIIIKGAIELALQGVAPVAIVFMVLAAVATLFGCTSLMIRFWTNLLTHSRENSAQPPRHFPTERPAIPPAVPPTFPRMDAIPSVTENTTRTLSAVYPQPSEKERR